ncbi:MAG: hypothetical protein ABIO63_07180 [Casimicrobiaceae bacterium]
MDRRSFLTTSSAVALSACVSVGGTAGPPVPAPVFRVGDRWIYNARDGFRVPVTWVETHEVMAVAPGGIEVRVTLLGETVNTVRTERLLSPGLVATGAVFNHDETRDFTPPLERFRFPLTFSETWTQNLANAVSPLNGQRPTINRYVRVGGFEKVSTSAGTFEAVLMRTIMSVDDNNPFRWPFQCNYETWFAPSVGAMVREFKMATYRERGDSRDAVDIRAQNTTVELASFQRGA